MGFLQRYAEDREAGIERSLQDYQALFLGHEQAIESKYAELLVGSAGGPSRPLRAGAWPHCVGRFRILEEIGRGGQGIVYLAEDPELHRRIALKVLPAGTELTPEAGRRFQREGEVASRLRHPGVCPVYEAGHSDGVAYIAMQYVEGETLAARIEAARSLAARNPGLQAGGGRSTALPARSRPSEVLAVVHMIERVARAAHAAHEAGIVHRDLKPANIRITPDGDPVILDFGMARDEVSAEPSLTRSGDVFGTPAYMSPEQLLGDLERVDRRADVYALGTTLYECLTLRRPFEAPTREALYRSILNDPPSSVRTLNALVPGDLAIVLETSLQKNPDHRYSTALELAEELRRVREHEPIRARPAGPLLRFTRWCQRNPWLAAAFGGLVFVLVAGLATTSYWLREARANAVEASRKASEVLRLSASQRLDELTAEADRLWPAHPENLRKYEDWLRKAHELVAELPVHERTLAELRSRAVQRTLDGQSAHRAAGAEIEPAPEWQFVDAQDSWWHGQLEKLVAGLHALFDPRTGLASCGISAANGWGVERRAEFARTIAERSVSGDDASRRWSEAIASIADAARCPPYGGLRITPQLGLLPIGRDPDSGLWEFAHIQTGEPAERGPAGRLVLTEETGLVLVLLPGGTFRMGAQRTDPDGANHDPLAQPDEGPVHEVTLSPFFLSKCEMTQGQWLRSTGENPSYHPEGNYAPEWNAAHRPWSALHPVEQVSWTTSRTTLDRLGLSLPSEAQWEYGARGGTTTAWWSGDARESLEGVANIADLYAREHGGEAWAIAHELWIDDGHTVHAEVGRYRANAFGLHDVIGNVWEWCLDGYERSFYGNGPTRDPVSGPEGCSTCVYRGGGFDRAASFARSALRGHVAPSDPDYSLGARPARRVFP